MCRHKKEHNEVHYEKNKKYHKEYYEKHTDKLIEYSKKYYESNKERINENNIKIVCGICGSTVSKYNISTHKKTNKCVNRFIIV